MGLTFSFLIFDIIPVIKIHVYFLNSLSTHFRLENYYEYDIIVDFTAGIKKICNINIKKTNYIVHLDIKYLKCFVTTVINIDGS